ncbi:MAG: zinc-binding alcohol dehydrogenase family protein [Alphaproteobacteria bacterium]|nr:zinc-binding alcohol dehydrogenase family protein [Alphaproteobacteria bacterium]
MRAMILEKIGLLKDNPTPLRLAEVPQPVPGPDEILIRVRVCGVCHTELDEIEGRTPPPKLSAILGHQVVGHVASLGERVEGFRIDDRVGVAWIHSACGQCDFCKSGRENLCLDFRATGRDVPGGYAEYMTVPAAFAYPIPAPFSDSEAAPLLCAGAIGYRSLRLTGIKDGQRLGLTGFGASAHLVLPLVRHVYPRTQIFVFARSESERTFARELGADWAGDTNDEAPKKLDAIIDTTPAWTPIVSALRNLERGGRLVVNAIRKEESDKKSLLDLDYPGHLWSEKEIKSVANVTRNDVRDFLKIAAEIPIRPELQEYALEDANQALMDLRSKSIRGAKVLKVC